MCFSMVYMNSNLKNTDYFGKSDPYCICRIGLKNTSWDHKIVKSEHCSETISNTLNPEWNFAMSFDYTNYSFDNLEFHLRIYDNDINCNDFLGELILSLDQIVYGEATEYSLINGNGSVVIICGSQVDKAIEDKLKRHEETKNIPMWLKSIQQYFEPLDDGLVYTSTMIQFLIAGMKSDVGLRKWFLKKGGQNGIWNGPEDSNCQTFLNHRDVVDRLSSLSKLFGTNNINGYVERQNNLGFQKLNSVVWENLENPIIGLGQTQEDHFFVRPYIERLIGPNGNWTREDIRKARISFLKNELHFPQMILRFGQQ